MKIFLSVCILFSLNFCSKKNRVTYWELSKFNLEPTALSDTENVKIIYYSNGQESTTEYYYHAVCVKESNSDTINVLMPIQTGIDKNSADKLFRFMGEESDAYKILSGGVIKDKSTESFMEEMKISAKRDKVYRDPAFDNIADNKFPTVIGLLGTFTKNQ